MSLCQAIIPHTSNQIFGLNKQDLKNCSCYKKVKVTYEAVSNSKFDTNDVQISFQLLT